MKYSAKNAGGDNWEIWQSLEHMEGIRQLCKMTTDEIIALYEAVVQEFKETVLVNGRPDCIHQWVPYKLNDGFKRCCKCPALVKIERLVPRRRA